ncbi:MAG: hypothetical protein IJI05_04495 [Erysipelotrichaceae bacterium]|nr:hypothetical protein [Erysipelotrichaceae bacterium]
MKMEKKYTYDKKRYAVRITGIGYFSIAMLVYALYRIVTSFSYAFVGMAAICCYIIFETFLSCANPNEVIISEKRITFKDPYRSDSYRWSDIHDFRVKEFPQRKQLYIRINKDKFDLFKGRYWVFCLYFNDCDELYKYLVLKEIEIHPDGLKAKSLRARSERNKKG